MPIWLLEPKPGSEYLWRGYDPLERIAVVAANDSEARKIAEASQPIPALPCLPSEVPATDGGSL